AEAVNGWKAARVIIHDAHVVVIPADASELYCLSLRDGRLLWTATRKDDDLYVAGVFGDKVLVVGKKECRALALKDGAAVWTVATGTPSGLGAAAGGVYYLSVKAGVDIKEPEVCAIDIARGKITAHLRSRKPELLGNLIFVDGLLISQTLT